MFRARGLRDRAITPLAENEPVLESKLASKESGRVAGNDPKGMRAITVAVNDVVGVAGL
jgi:Flp pilus assembly protein CpaB